MPLILLNGQLLLVGKSIALNSDCCCGLPCALCETGGFQSQHPTATLAGVQTNPGFIVAESSGCTFDWCLGSGTGADPLGSVSTALNKLHELNDIPTATCLSDDSFEPLDQPGLFGPGVFSLSFNECCIAAREFLCGSGDANDTAVQVQTGFEVIRNSITDTYVLMRTSLMFFQVGIETELGIDIALSAYSQHSVADPSGCFDFIDPTNNCAIDCTLISGFSSSGPWYNEGGGPFVSSTNYPDPDCCLIGKCGQLPGCNPVASPDCAANPGDIFDISNNFTITFNGF